MKLKLLITAIVCSTVSVFAQGLVSFQNGTFQKFFVNDTANGGSRALMGTTPNLYTFYIKYGTSADALNTTSASVFNSSATAGLLAGNASFALTGTTPGVPFFLQVYGFETSAGSYANALATGGKHAGVSSVVQVTPTGSPAAGTVIFANAADSSHIAAFDLFVTPVPEPSTYALAVAAMGTVFYFRRRK